MPEGINLAQPYHDREPAETMRHGSVFIQLYTQDPNGSIAYAPYVRAILLGENGAVVRREVHGAEAEQIIGQLNSADLRTNTLGRRVLAWVQAGNPEMAGTIGDLPTNPATARFEGMTKTELQAEADRLGIAVEGTGSGGSVLKSDLITALAGANP